MSDPSVLPKPARATFSGEPLKLAGLAPEGPEALGWLVDRFERTSKIPLTSAGTPLRLVCETPDFTPPALHDAEGYRLRIGADGINLEAPHWRGIAHGLTTLGQLIEGDTLPLGEIEDAPRFEWRGLKLDCVRHFIKPATVRRILDGMAEAKMNVLHWGLSNYQGFRLESERFPRLHTKASNGQFYTKAQARDLIDHAVRLGIRVVPEFNMPGHSTAFLVAYPELAAHEAPAEPYGQYSIINDVMDPTKEAVFSFIQDFVGEYAGLFPDSHWHMGGDEVMGKHWDENPAIAAYKQAEGLADNHALQARFTERYAAILRGAGKMPMGWEEVSRGKPDPERLVIESWIDWAGSDHCSPYACVSATGYYLDHFLTAADHYRIDPEAQGGAVMGGEAAVWTEAMMDETVEGYIWPRAGAIAERLWSPRDTTDEDDLYRRLSRFDARLEAGGAQQHKARARVLDRAAGGKADDQWALFAGALRPTAYYFLRWEGYDAKTPADRLVQALDADPPAARRFNRGVARYLETGEGRGSLEATLNSWLGAARTVPLSADDQPLADALAQMCELGLAVLRGDTDTDPSVLDRTVPAFPKTALVPDILDAIFTVFGDQNRPLCLQHMNLAGWPGVKALAEHTRSP